MPTLFIAEKPSLARAIAAGLPSPQNKEQGFIRCANGDVVTWCIGHLLEQVEPDAYDEKYKRWRLEDLPILPQKWQLKPRKSAAKQLSVVRKLLKEFESVVHAGDPDREGQLLVDEVIDYCKVSKAKKERMQRLLISDLNLAAVKQALKSMRSNREFIPLSVSALARSRADWLYGINMSRAYTLLGQKAGYQGVLTVGRVQSPLVGLVVRRDEEIETFISKDYYTLDALIPSLQGDQAEIQARWQPSPACEPWQDDEGRVLNRKLIENVASRIANQPAVVVSSEQKQSKQAAPLPYSLSALQIDAAKRFGFSAQQVLDACQSLYEKHKLITYPRSDCRYLPKDHWSQSKTVLGAISNNSQTLKNAAENADSSIKSKAWNDAKVDAHHAIIPTPKKASLVNLTPQESRVYEQIARQYVMQFYPAALYADSKLEFDIAGGCFIAKGRVLLESGWKAVMAQGREQGQKRNKSEIQEDLNPVPALAKGTELCCREGVIKDKKTEPPKHFTEATLLQAMTGIARFVQDNSLKQILRETDGLGTEATRASIIEALFKRSLLMRRGKTILSTPAGRGLVHALPAESTYPDMTAHWEHQLQAISDKKQAYQPFMAGLETKIASILAGIMSEVESGSVPQSLRNLPPLKKPPSKKASFNKGSKFGRKKKQA